MSDEILIATLRNEMNLARADLQDALRDNARLAAAIEKAVRDITHTHYEARGECRFCLDFWPCHPARVAEELRKAVA